MSDPKRALDRLLASELDPDTRAEISRRIDAGHDPGAILEDVDSLDLLAATASDQALSSSEADELFAGILGAVDAEQGSTAQPATAAPEPANNYRYFLAALLLAAAVLLVVMPNLGDDAYQGLKGDGDLDAPVLQVFLGDGQGGVGRALKPGESLPDGSRLIFRYRSPAPARAVLLADEAGTTQVAWISDDTAPGAHEVRADGQALAWTLDQPVTFGLRLLPPEASPGAMTLEADCTADDPCTRFGVDTTH